jgi:hypothetical protein
VDAIENGTTSLRKGSRHWSIPLTSFLDNMYGKTKFRKLGLASMLTVEKDQVVVAWVLSMEEVGLSINLQ